jgi:predicted molibdopterin-dependent oxidoreductase YjgC
MFQIKEIDFGTPAARSEKMITLTVDGFEVSVPEGTSVMRAASEAGISVPKLCATDMLDAFGSCRLCLVEIEGRAGTPASCTTPVAPGMVVHTQTGRLKDLRKGVMELYISDHPLDCLTCAANGDCELQDMAGAVGLRDVRYTRPWTPISAPETLAATSIRSGWPRTRATRISPMTRRNASSARAACAPARKSRAPSR